MERNAAQSPEHALTVHQVAERLNVSARTVWGWVAGGRLRAIKLGKKTTRIPEGAIEEFLRSCEGAER